MEVSPASGSSALRWGTGAPELVLLHGGAQNAHTWDTVALALGRPLLAIDLPGHGHSDWRDGPLATSRPRTPAPPSTRDPRAGSRGAKAVVGMSLGGLTALALVDRGARAGAPAVLVDVTPGVDKDKASAVIAFIAGPRVVRELRRDPRTDGAVQPDPLGVVAATRHPAQRRRSDPTGRWAWRYERFELPEGAEMPDFGSLVGLRRRGRRPAAARTRRRLAGRERRGRRRAASAGSPVPGSSWSRKPDTACRATSRWSSRASSRSDLDGPPA